LEKKGGAGRAAKKYEGEPDALYHYGEAKKMKKGGGKVTQKARDG